MKLRLEILDNVFYMRDCNKESYDSLIIFGFKDCRYSLSGYLLEDCGKYERGEDVRSIRRLLKICRGVF